MYDPLKVVDTSSFFEDVEDIFLDSLGLDDYAYQKAALFYSEEIVGLDKTFLDGYNNL